MKTARQRFTRSLLVPVLSIVISIVVARMVEISSNAYLQLILLYTCVNIILATSLNLVNGFTGQFSLGHAGFMAVGGYLSAWLSTKVTFVPDSVQFLNFPIYAVCGGLGAAAAGLIVGLPSLRLKGDYLAIVTLGFGEIIRVVLLNLDAVGGARGFYGIPGVKPVIIDLGAYQLELSTFFISFSMALMWTAFTFLILWRVIHSTHGRAFLSVREDEVAAEAMGINTTRTKVASFVLSSFFAGVAGSIFAHFANYLNPSTFQFIKSVDVVIMVVLGGMGSLTGSVLAAIFVTVLPEALRPLQELTGYDLRMVIYSSSLILLMITRPQGLLGSLELPDLWRRYVRKSA